MRLFEEAEIIAGAHGTNLANIIFGDGATGVIEIISQAFFDPSFMRIANVAGVKYDHVVSRVIEDETREPRLRDAIVDVEEVAQAVERMIERLSTRVAWDPLRELTEMIADGAGFVFRPESGTGEADGAAAVKISSDGVAILQLADGPQTVQPSVSDGFRITLPEAFGAGASRKRIRIRAVVRAANGGGAKFGLCYVNDRVASSGWRWFETGGNWEVVEMRYSLPDTRGSGGAFLSLLPPAVGGVEIALVSVSIL